MLLSKAPASALSVEALKFMRTWQLKRLVPRLRCGEVTWRTGPLPRFGLAEMSIADFTRGDIKRDGSVVHATCRPYCSRQSRELSPYGAHAVVKARSRRRGYIFGPSQKSGSAGIA
jgi:hypothetical protein